MRWSNIYLLYTLFCTGKIQHLKYAYFFLIEGLFNNIIYIKYSCGNNSQNVSDIFLKH